MTATPPPDLVSALGDRYRVERILGAGGMAVVYLATELKHQRQVALKVLRSEVASSVGAERFLAEIQITARLDHPRILTLIDSGQAGEHVYYVIPYVRGESLRALLDREGSLPFSQVVALVGQVAGALDYAHRQGIIHRDLKPDNILLFEGEAMLADFGIALAVGDARSPRLTTEGHSLGTPYYMSPEQAAGVRDLTPQSDIYSLAAMTFEMLAGRPPFLGGSAQEVLAKHLAETAPELRSARNDVPGPVAAILRRGMSKSPADRPPDASTFAEALRSGADSRTLLLTSAATPVRARAWWITGALVGALAIGGVVWSFVGRTPTFAPPVPLQLTSSGYADLPALSPDGGQVAYAEGVECPQRTTCPVALKLREASGDVTRTLLDSLSWAFPFKWSADGRWILFNGYGPGYPPGQYVISRLGGTPTPVGIGAVIFKPASDTILFAPVPRSSLQSRVTVEVRPPPWRSAVDSFVVEAPSKSLLLMNLQAQPGGRWLALGWSDALWMTRLVAIHGVDGKVVDTRSVPDPNLMRWSRDGRALLCILTDPRGGRGARVLRLPVDPRTGKFGLADTLLLGHGVDAATSFDFTPDGRTLVYAGRRGGPTRVVALAEGAPGSRPLATSSTDLGAEITPDGRQVLIRQRVPGLEPARWRWGIFPFEGRASDARVVTPPLASNYSATAVDDRHLFLLAYDSSAGTSIVAYDLQSGEARIRARGLPAVSGLALGPAAAILVLTDEGAALRWIDSTGATRWVRPIPDSLGRLVAVVADPDGRGLLAMGQPTGIEPGDDGLLPVSVVAISADSGKLSRAGIVRATLFAVLGRSPDGWLHLGLSTTADLRMARYRWRPGIAAPIPERGPVPSGCAADAAVRRFICVEQETLTDIFLLKGLDGI
jgi:serine/threonine protein kinase